MVYNERYTIHTMSDSDKGLKIAIAIYGKKYPVSIGGCRVLPFRCEDNISEEALKLATAMHDKSRLYDLPFNGAKAIMSYKNDRKEAFMEFGKFVNSLGGQYVTALDLGTEQVDMDIAARYTKHVAVDAVEATAKGIVESINLVSRAKLGATSLQGLKISIQGVGKVGSLVTEKLYKAGAIISICDVNIKAVLNTLSRSSVRVVDPKDIYDVEADIFCPCAFGSSLTLDNAPKIKAQIILGAANNQLSGDDVVDVLLKKNILYVPDSLVNSGGVIFAAYSYLGMPYEHAMNKVDDMSRLISEFLDILTNEKNHPLKALSRLHLARSAKLLNVD